jgi:beta-lactamase regulating signal transducer with metallopeptidase domain
VQQQMRVAVTPAQAAKSQATAAIGGLVTAVLALAVVASTFAFQMAYKDYFTCQQDALTRTSAEQCQELLPENLRPFLENRG